MLQIQWLLSLINRLLLLCVLWAKYTFSGLEANNNTNGFVFLWFGD